MLSCLSPKFFTLTKSSTPSFFPSTVRIPIVQPTPTPTYQFSKILKFCTLESWIWIQKCTKLIGNGPKRLSNGVPKHAATAVLAFPALANEISDTKSPMEFAHARNVNPMIADSIFQIKPRAVNRPTTSFATV